MPKETFQWLNTMTLIGFTAKRGHAWHYRGSGQGAEPKITMTVSQAESATSVASASAEITAKATAGRSPIRRTG